jgi:hypothetical protein
MRFLQNSTKGLEWSEKWQQHYFRVPPYVYNGAAVFPGLRELAPATKCAFTAMVLPARSNMIVAIAAGFPYPRGVNQTVTIWQ